MENIYFVCISAKIHLVNVITIDHNRIRKIKMTGVRIHLHLGKIFFVKEFK